MWATEEAAPIHEEGGLLSHLVLPCWHRPFKAVVSNTQVCEKCGSERDYEFGEEPGPWRRPKLTAWQRKPFEEVA